MIEIKFSPGWWEGEAFSIEWMINTELWRIDGRSLDFVSRDDEIRP